MQDPYYVTVPQGPAGWRAVVAALRAHRAGRLQGLRFWVRRPGGALWLQQWDVEDAAEYWLRATRGDYGGLDAVEGYSHRDPQWLEG